jgi:hypothetical protein
MQIPAWLPLLAIAVITFAVHFPGLWGAYNWDDDDWLLTRDAVKHWNTFGDLWVPGATPHYFPMVMSTYWLEYKLWGFGSVGADGVGRGIGYHVDNLLLHIGSSMLLFAIVRRFKLPGGALAAWMAATIFAVHPVNVESVAWVAERKNVLCGLFFFASLFFACKVFDLYAEPSPHRQKDQWLGWLLFLAAMLSKTTACFLPPALLVLAWWKRGRLSRSDVVASIPFFVIALTLGALSIYFEGAVAGTGGPAWDFSLLQRVLIAGNAFWFYIGKLLWPFPLMAIYPRFPIDAGKPVTDAWLYVAPIGCIALLASLMLTIKQIGRGPLAAMLLFAGGLFPTLGFLSFYTMLYSFVADHYVYLACPFFFVLVVEILAWVIRHVAGVVAPKGADAARTSRLLLGCIGGGIVLSLGLVSFGVSHIYRNDAELWDFNFQHNPDNFAVNFQYAKARLAQRPPDFESASALIRHAIALNPDDWHAYDAARQMYEMAGDREHAAAAARDAEFRRSVTRRAVHSSVSAPPATSAGQMQEAPR